MLAFRAGGVGLTPRFWPAAAWLSLIGFLSLTIFLACALRWTEKTIRLWFSAATLLRRFAPATAERLADKLRALIKVFRALREPRNMIPFLAQTVLYWFSNGIWNVAARTRTCNLPSLSRVAFAAMAFLPACSFPLPNSPGSGGPVSCGRSHCLGRLLACGHGQLLSAAPTPSLSMESSLCGTWDGDFLRSGRWAKAPAHCAPWLSNPNARLRRERPLDARHTTLGLPYSRFILAGLCIAPDRGRGAQRGNVRIDSRRLADGCALLAHRPQLRNSRRKDEAARLHPVLITRKVGSSTKGHSSSCETSDGDGREHQHVSWPRCPTCPTTLSQALARQAGAKLREDHGSPAPPPTRKPEPTAPDGGASP